MEVKINREIRNYTESMFFGLSLRQFVFSLLAVGVAVGLYFLLRPYLGTETVSWVCILGAVPFAALGFVSYHGMTAEQFLWAWIRSELLEPNETHWKRSQSRLNISQWAWSLRQNLPPLQRLRDNLWREVESWQSVRQSGERNGPAPPILGKDKRISHTGICLTPWNSPYR